MTIWGSLLKMNLKKLTQLYTIANVNGKNYFGLKLTATIHINVSEIGTDKPLPDWSREDVKAYLNGERK